MSKGNGKKPPRKAKAKPPAAAQDDLSSEAREMMENAELFAEDVQRIRSLPPAALTALRDHLQRVLDGVERPDSACIWLDRNTMRCRYHDHRPMICRDFEIASDGCRDWRKQYEIDQ